MKKGWKQFFPQNKLIQHSEGNEDHDTHFQTPTKQR
jgi:hypothetical protein